MKTKIEELKTLVETLETTIQEVREIIENLEVESGKPEGLKPVIFADKHLWKLDPRTGYYASAPGEIGIYDLESRMMRKMKRYISSDGYVSIRPPRTRKCMRIHPIIARAWIDPKYYEKGFVVRFIDGNTYNASLNNIELTPRSNDIYSKNRTRLSKYEVQQICIALIALRGDISKTLRFAKEYIRKGICYQVIVNIRNKTIYDEISDKYFNMISGEFVPVYQVNAQVVQLIEQYVDEAMLTEKLWLHEYKD